MEPDTSTFLGFLGSVPEKAFFRVLDGAPDALVLIDAEGQIRFVNAQAERLFGYPRDELLGQAIELLVPERFRSSHVGSRNRFMRAATLRPMGSGLELYGRRKDGREFPVEISLSPLETEQGLFISSSIRDVSERKRAELATNLLAAIVDSSADAIISATLDGVITSWNRGAERIFGYTSAEAAGQPLTILQTADARSSVSDPFQRVCRGEYVEQFETVQRHKSGRDIPISVTWSPIRDGRGTLVGASKIAQDVTERKRIEAAAKLATERLLSAVESIQAMFALFDGDERLVLCNSEFRQFFVRPTGTLVGMPFADLLEASLADDVFALDGERASEFRARWLAYRREPRGTLDVRTKDGHTLRVAERQTAEGGSVTTIWDITEDMKRQDELSHARAIAEAASEAKSEFLSSMSHELRTPLNAILGFAQLLWRDKKTPPTERQKDRLEHILKAGEHLLRLIDDVLDLSRIEAGHLSISLEAVSVGDVLAEVQRTLEPMATRANVRLEVGSVPEDARRVRADRTRFAQVLINFGSNAIKYGRAQGTTTFTVSRPAPTMLRVSVSDDGQGIAAELHDKIFLPFQRAGQELGTIEGTGIGLTICRRVAELMEGSVGFRSVLGEGSTFWIDLPLLSAADGAAEQARASLDATSKLSDAQGVQHTVLYVEDNPSNIAFMRELIADFERIELLVAPTAEIGLEMARARLPDVVIMDINLPGMSGIEAAQKLRQWPETRDLPIIALSAAAMTGDRLRAQTAVFHRYLTKPVKVDELIETLEPLLERAERAKSSSRQA
jgi:PAS domain S-box-containing protein